MQKLLLYLLFQGLLELKIKKEANQREFQQDYEKQLAVYDFVNGNWSFWTQTCCQIFNFLVWEEVI